MRSHLTKVEKDLRKMEIELAMSNDDMTSEWRHYNHRHKSRLDAGRKFRPQMLPGMFNDPVNMVTGSVDTIGRSPQA